MHALATQVPIVLATEKSRTAFYIVGAVLVAWALLVSLGIGLRRSSFPTTPTLARLVMAISAILVVATGATAVITSGTPAKSATSASTVPAPSTSSPSAAPTPGASSLALEAATNQLAYNTKHLTAKAGTITITFTNNSALEHNVTVARPGLRPTQAGAVLGATPTFKGGSRKLVLKLQAGTYVYYCSVPGHREAGMEGTLTVT
jgi:plastocyanin